MLPNLVSFVILIGFFYGRSLRHRNGRRHSYWMIGVIIADVGLVGYLAVARDALSKVNSTMEWPLIVHLSFALSTVVLYLFALWFGIRQMRGTNSRRQLRLIDRIVVPTRVLTLLTSIMLYALATR